jgi:Ca2+-binding RTX toxin-like protein
MGGDDFYYLDDGNDFCWDEPTEDEDEIIRGGNDTVYGGAGNDTIETDSGNDVIRAGAGNDYVTAGEGHDTIHAENGNDRVYAGDGDDYVNGGAGSDYMLGGGGSDRIDSRDRVGGNDTLYGGWGPTDTANGYDIALIDSFVDGLAVWRDVHAGFDEIHVN